MHGRDDDHEEDERQRIPTINSDELDRLRKSAEDDAILSNEPPRSVTMEINTSKIKFDELLRFRASIKSMGRRQSMVLSGPDLKERAQEEIAKIDGIGVQDAQGRPVTPTKKDR